ncbi:MAG: nitroreductase family protein, partial [Desulfosudaceae bacterium]
MKKRLFPAVCLVMLVLLLSSFPAPGQDGEGVVALPEPQMDTGRPLMRVLQERHSTRSFSDRMLPEQKLSNLLWAAFGVNRPDSGKRTAPSARNWQEIDIYVATADGLYLYDAGGHELQP